VDTGTSPQVAEPPRFVTSPERINLDITNKENRAVKDEVLTRVDLMPVSQMNKDKLYNAVEKARSMGKILTIPFGSGKTDLSPADLDALKAELEKPQVNKLRDDPTAVFVILGYADPKGDPKKNLTFSTQRADAVMKTMRDKLGVINLMHTVGMGGSKLLDAQNLEKNRIVEIWAVLP
jgi:outer membrane protein OmpA-like peptidoglycan-associated protein